MKRRVHFALWSLLIISALLSPLASLAQEAITEKRLSQLATIEEAEDERTVDKKLLSFLDSDDRLVQERAVIALGRIGDRTVVDRLSLILNSAVEPRLAALAAFSLGEIESTKAFDPLMKILNGDGSIIVRTRAAEALAKIVSSSKVPQELGAEKRKKMIEIVLRNLPAPTVPQEGNQLVYSGMLITALLRLKDESAVPALLEQLSSVNAELRWQSANALVRMKVDLAKYGAKFLPLLSDGEPLPRAYGARALGAAGAKDASAKLIELLKDRDERVRACAITALGTAGDTVAVLELINYGRMLLKQMAETPLAAGSVPQEQNDLLLIASALGTLKDERAIPFLRECREAFKFRGFQSEIELALASFGEQAYFELSAPEPGAGFQSVSAYAQALGSLKCDKASAKLHELLSSNSDPRAIPELLNGIAACKAPDLQKILLAHLGAADPVVKATAASLIAESGPADELLKDSIKSAFIQSQADKMNDARIALLEAASKLHYPLYKLALEGKTRDPDYLLRKKALELAAADSENSDLSGLQAGPVKSGHDAKYWKDMARLSLLKKNPRAVLHLKKGDLVIEFYPADAPMTVNNFLILAGKGYFNGLSFMRVVPNFVVQGGDPRNDMNGGPGYQIRCEINERPYLSGTLGMALSGKDTGGSQFFITHSPQPHLDGGYTVFGRLVSGMDVLPKIARGDLIEKVELLD